MIWTDTRLLHLSLILYSGVRKWRLWLALFGHFRERVFRLVLHCASYWQVTSLRADWLTPRRDRKHHITVVLARWQRSQVTEVTVYSGSGFPAACFPNKASSSKGAAKLCAFCHHVWVFLIYFTFRIFHGTGWVDYLHILFIHTRCVCALLGSAFFEAEQWPLDDDHTLYTLFSRHNHMIKFERKDERNQQRTDR